MAMDARREAILEQIRQAFPKKPRVKKALKLARRNFPYYEKRLEEEFRGKTWEEALALPKIVYMLSDIDYLREFTDEAYCYYLPAFLTAVMLETSKWLYSAPIEYIGKLHSLFSAEQIAAIIAFLEYQAEFARADIFYNARIVDEIENLALKLMAYQAELETGEVE
jgi:hypothetical protein